MTNTEKNKEAVKKYYQAWNTGNTAELKNYISDNVVDHHHTPAGTGREGLDNISLYIRDFRNGFSNFQIVINEIVADDNSVIAYTTTRGSHKGDFWGIPATNRDIHVDGFDRFKLENGVITQRWGVFDNLKLLIQLGFLPTEENLLQKVQKEIAS